MGFIAMLENGSFSHRLEQQEFTQKCPCHSMTWTQCIFSTLKYTMYYIYVHIYKHIYVHIYLYIYAGTQEDKINEERFSQIYLIIIITSICINLLYVKMYVYIFIYIHTYKCIYM